MIVLGVAAWLPILAFLLGLIVTDGSWWSAAFCLAAVVVAWARARSLAVWRDGDLVTVRNFHSTRTLRLKPSTRLSLFRHWAQPNFDCLALHTPGETLLQMHGTALPQRPSRHPAAYQAAANAFDIPFDEQAIGTFRQLTRRW